MLPSPSKRISGATIVEAAIAAALLTLLFGGLFAVSGQSFRLIRSSAQQSAATFCLQQRIEEVRCLTWAQLTDAIWIRDNVLNAAAGAESALPGRSEQITVNAYPTATTATVVVRPASGLTAVNSSNPALSGETMLRVDAQIAWADPSGRTNTRQFTTVVTQGGITR